MALLFMDGFDHSGTSSATHGTKYSSLVQGVTLVTSPVRTGPNAVRFGSGLTPFLYSKPIGPIPSGTAIIFGVAFQKNLDFPGTRVLFGLQEGVTVLTHVSVAITATGLLVVNFGASSVTGTTVLGSGGWYYLELKAVIHDTAGSYELRIDGVTELSATGVDTRNGGAAGLCNAFFLSGPNTSSPYGYFDDLYLCDGTGAAPHNDFLGPCKVETLLPQTGNGTNVGLTPSTGTDHGALVDDLPANTTDYNGSATVGLKDTYHYPSMALTGAVLGIQANLYAAKSDAGARSVCSVVRAGGTDYDGANLTLSTGFEYLSQPWALNPNTGLAWTASDIAALEAGMKVTV